MSQKKTLKKDAGEFQEIFSDLNSNNKQYTLAIIRSLQFAEEQERARWAKELSLNSDKQTKGGDAPC